MGFRDDFDGGALDSRWSALTSGSGAVTVTDSYVECNAPAANDAAAFYLNTQFDKTKSQLLLFHATVSALGGPRTFYIIQKATAPAAGAISTWDADNNTMRIRAILQNVGGGAVGFAYWPSGSGRIEWDTAAVAWGGTAKSAMPADTDHYTVIGFENDAVNARFRFLAWGPYESGAGSDKHGMVLRAITDWVNWSALGTTDSLWLVCGDPMTDSQSGVGRWERIEVQDGAKRYAMMNGQSAAGNYRIRVNWGYEDVDGGVSVWIPKDRTSIAIDVGSGGAWDEFDVKDPYVVQDGSTFYCFYNGRNAAGKIQIGLASATDFEGTWTKDAANPVVARNASAGERDSVFFPGVAKDLADPDSNKRWKMWFTANDSGVSLPQKTYYTTAPAPAGTWATPTLAVDLTGTSGTFEENGHERPRPVWDGTQWVVFLGAKKADTNVSIRPTYATAPVSAPGTLTRSGVILMDVLDAGSTQDITANITATRTVTVGSTSSFAKNRRCVIDQDATSGNYTEFIPRKILSGTQFETYEKIDGFTTTSPAAQIRAIQGWGRVVPADIVRVGAEWWMYITAFNPMLDHATFSAGMEDTGLMKSSSLTSGWAHFDNRPVPAARHTFGCAISNENISTVHQPVHAGVSFLPKPPAIHPLLVR